MATRIRLQRHGKKGKPVFHLVAADSRAKRDGKFIEKLGVYDPNTNPATITINFDRTLSWVQTGAEMSDTARAILSYKGILFKNHLLNGIKKGALTAEQVEEKFAAWEAEKASKVLGKIEGLDKNAVADKAARLKAEADTNAAKAKAIEAKNTPEVEEVAEEEVAAPAEEVTEAPEAAAPAEETPAVEAVVEAAPAVEEAPAVDEETPVAEEAKTEETAEGEQPEA